MRTLNRILLVSDRSATTDFAVLYAAALARQAQARILAMQVVETAVTAFPRWTDIFRSSEFIAEREAEGHAALERLAAHQALSELDVHYLLDHGHPADRITDMAPQVDLIVMGTGDSNSAGGHAMQRIAKEVAHGSVTPVLLVPPGGGTAGTPSPETAQLPWQRLLLAIDIRGYAPQAIDIATSLASTQHASLIALQVLNAEKLSAYPVGAGEGMHHNLQGLKILLAKRLSEVLPDASEGPPYLREVVEGEAAPVIIAQAAAHQADLIIVSAHPYGAIQKLFIPSTIDTLLEEITCPILAVPFPRSILGLQAALA